MCRARSFQLLVDLASDGGRFTSVLRTKMAIPRVLPGEATIPCGGELDRITSWPRMKGKIPTRCCKRCTPRAYPEAGLRCACARRISNVLPGSLALPSCSIEATTFEPGEKFRIGC